MEASVLIVSRNRCVELQKTLRILQKCIDKSKHEILVFLDGCSDSSEKLRESFPEVKWVISKITFGASKARSILYKKARGRILFGFDDDSHPIQPDFIKKAIKLFSENGQIGILAFKEIKGRFAKDKDIPPNLKEMKEDYLVKDFLGCGFAIRKEIYDKTRGFPVWIDIYGEEVCVALETLELGYDVLFTHQILINHRTNKQKMNIDGANYFRFGKQLKNTSFFYLVYYPFPLLLKKIGRLYFLNFKKYGLKDKSFFREYFYACWQMFINIRKIIKHRRPISKKTLDVFNSLSNPNY